VFDPQKLVGTRYALSIEEAKLLRKCGTPIILEIREIWNKLSPKTKDQLKWVFLRPTDPGGGTDGNQHLLPQLYGTEHFLIHWTNGADGGLAEDAPPLTDSDANGTPDYIENLGAIFEYVLNFEISNRGFDMPPNDAGLPSNDANNRNPDGRYDIFVYDMDPYGYVQAEYLVWDTPENDATSFIAVENDYAGFPGTQLGCMQVTAAHEFHHAIQFGYDYEEKRWWMETTSTYMEDEVYPDINDNYQYLHDWFEYSDTYGLETFNGSHEYGNFIFAKRLSEDFGDDVIREIWVECQETDGLTAIDNVLSTKGSSLVEEFNNFTKANFFLEDTYVDGTDYRAAIDGILNPSWDTTYDGVWLEYQYDEEVDGLPFIIDSTNVNCDAWMDKWAADYITIKMSGATPGYKITFDGLDSTTNYDVSLVTKKAGGIITTKEFSLNSDKDGSVFLPYDAAYTDIVLIIRNSGNTSTADPSWKVKIEEASVLPDLTITNITSSPNPSALYQDVQVTVEFKNQGNADAGWFRIDLYTDRDTAPRSEEEGDYIHFVSGLPAGAANSYTFSSISYLTEGERQIWAQIDTNDDINESNESNNIYGPYTHEVVDVYGLSFSTSSKKWRMFSVPAVGCSQYQLY